MCIVSLSAHGVFSLDYSKILASGLNVSILLHFPAARWFIVLPKRDHSPGWHSSGDLLFNTCDHQHLPKQVIPLYFLFCMAFLCQMMCVNSRDLKLVFHGSDVLFLKKKRLVRSSIESFLCSSCLALVWFVFLWVWQGWGMPAFPQGCGDMEYRKHPSMTWVPCC